MKFYIDFHDTGLKKKKSKGFAFEILILESVFKSFLLKNPHFLGVRSVTMSLTLCGRTKIRAMNRNYRQKDYVTDVLSFPVNENLRADQFKKSENIPDLELGDVIICKEKARSQAKFFKITYEQEIIHLAVHGLLHLLGFDHELSLKEEKIMEKEEAFLVKKIYKKIIKVK